MDMDAADKGDEAGMPPMARDDSEPIAMSRHDTPPATIPTSSAALGAHSSDVRRGVHDSILPADKVISDYEEDNCDKGENQDPLKDKFFSSDEDGAAAEESSYIFSDPGDKDYEISD